KAVGAALPVAIVAAAASATVLALSSVYIHLDILKGKWADMSNTVSRYGLKTALSSASGFDSVLGWFGLYSDKALDDKRRNRSVELATQSAPRQWQYNRDAAMVEHEGISALEKERYYALTEPGVERM